MEAHKLFAVIDLTVFLSTLFAGRYFLQIVISLAIARKMSMKF